jgi:hypothetical protein
MKLSVNLLDNSVKSAVIDIGKNNGYVEVFVSNGIVHLNVFNRDGDVVHEWTATAERLRLSSEYTTPKFELAHE